jgi:hypothetical protein
MSALWNPDADSKSTKAIPFSSPVDLSFGTERDAMGPQDSKKARMSASLAVKGIFATNTVFSLDLLPPLLEPLFSVSSADTPDNRSMIAARRFSP